MCTWARVCVKIIHYNLLQPLFKPALSPPLAHTIFDTLLLDFAKIYYMKIIRTG